MVQNKITFIKSGKFVFLLLYAILTSKEQSKCNKVFSGIGVWVLHREVFGGDGNIYYIGEVKGAVCNWWEEGDNR